ncbi:MAG: AEC family transporter [Lachnospiraceae bacterium]|nr:AEC family transporter [Lachnospiraceae bacterium]
MELSLLLMSKLFSMTLWSIVGFVLVKIGILRASDSGVLSKLTLYALVPSMLLRIFQIELTPERLRGLGASMLFAVIVHLIWIGGTYLLAKPLKLTIVDRATLIYTNCGNLLLPLITMILDDEHAFYAIGFMSVFNVLIWLHGVPLIRGDQKPEFLKGLLNPNVIALTISFVLALSGFRFPGIIDTSLKGLADMVGPCSMLVIGMVIANASLKDVFTSRKTYLITFGRLIVLPVLTMLLLWASRIVALRPEFREVFLISMLAVSAPPAAMVSQLAAIYDKDAESAGLYNIMGVLFCIITIPMMIALYQFMF